MPEGLLVGGSVPPKTEVVGDVGDHWALETNGGVVPADPAPRRVLLAVVRVTAVVRQVDATHERDAVVDHDRLLVVAVHQSDAGVELAVDLGPAPEVLDHRSYVAARRAEHRQRCSAPDQHADGNAFGELPEEIAQRLVLHRA